MEFIPEQFRFQMMIDTIILQKNNLGWREIHDSLLFSSLYLKKTTSPYVECSMMYEYILRANTMVYFTNGKTFTWLRQMSHSPSIYFYRPLYMDAEMYVGTTNSYGYFLD